ncbi:MAG: carboxymuconolactone decarboxylase family protein [Burkholderiales bacterium]|nr:carboxymuconolactone decarboxylase family protein [Burkholderiales bacterium]
MNTARLPLIDPETLTDERRDLLEQVRQAYGRVPHMMRAMAHSRVALRSVLGTLGAARAGVLPPLLREQIAVLVAARNRCDHCLAVHTALGRRAGASAQAMAEAQAGESADAATHAALQFALAVVERRGAVREDELQALRDAGFGDEAVLEILAHVALNIFMNYVNLALAVPLDVPPLAPA